MEGARRGAWGGSWALRSPWEPGSTGTLRLLRLRANRRCLLWGGQALLSVNPVSPGFVPAEIQPRRGAAAVCGAGGPFPTPGAAPVQGLGERSSACLQLCFFFHPFLYCRLSVPADTVVRSAPSPPMRLKHGRLHCCLCRCQGTCLGDTGPVPPPPKRGSAPERLPRHAVWVGGQSCAAPGSARASLIGVAIAVQRLFPSVWELGGKRGTGADAAGVGAGGRRSSMSARSGLCRAAGPGVGAPLWRLEGKRAPAVIHPEASPECPGISLPPAPVVSHARALLRGAAAASPFQRSLPPSRFVPLLEEAPTAAAPKADAPRALGTRPDSSEIGLGRAAVLQAP